MELANSTTQGPLPCPESRSLPIYPYTTGRRAVPCEGSAVAKTWHPSGTGDKSIGPIQRAGWVKAGDGWKEGRGPWSRPS